LSDIAEFCCHPGGAKVLDALEDVFGVRRGGLVHSRNVLRRYGNMSAATVLFVLAESLAGGGGRRLLTAMGPGFTAGFLLLEGS
jgi:alkylresorcinol/alkylpyrone synthase